MSSIRELELSIHDRRMIEICKSTCNETKIKNLIMELYAVRCNLDMKYVCVTNVVVWMFEVYDKFSDNNWFDRMEMLRRMQPENDLEEETLTNKSFWDKAYGVAIFVIGNSKISSIPGYRDKE